jgi:cytochrome c-type biogenesis protein CcmH
MTRLVALLLVALAALAPVSARAADALPTEKDSVAASRAVKLSEKLRCLVCQNQSISESNAELALDLRRQIGEQIAAGRSDDEILGYMVARYGDFVLYQPPVKGTTLLLWGGPGLLLVGGLAALVVILRRRRKVAPEPPLSAAERERAKRMLEADTPED